MTLKEVLERNSVKEIYEYAKYHPEADMELLTAALLNAGRYPIVNGKEEKVYYPYDEDEEYDDYLFDRYDDDLEKYYCKFALEIPGANIEWITQAIIESGQSEYIYELARNVSGVNISQLEDALDIASYGYIKEFALEIPGADIDKLVNRLEKHYQECHQVAEKHHSEIYMEGLKYTIECLKNIKNESKRRVKKNNK